MASVLWHGVHKAHKLINPLAHTTRSNEAVYWGRNQLCLNLSVQLLWILWQILACDNEYSYEILSFDFLSNYTSVKMYVKKGYNKAK